MSTKRTVDAVVPISLGDDVRAKMLERLRASRHEAEADAATQGRQDGFDWAANIADWRELVLLDEVASGHKDGSTEPPESMQGVAIILDPTGERGYVDFVEEYSISATEFEQAAHATGFVIGATEAFALVKTEI